MSTILTETEGFTPVIDVLAQELGLMTAVVYGIVWRYCQMENKVCSASRETIAEHANISVKTVDRHLDKLCKAGYLKDLHPDWKHRPHIYADTGKLKIEALVKVRSGETESPTSAEGRTESPTGETESPTGRTESLTGETESPTKIPSYDSSYDSQLGEKDADSFPEKSQPDPAPAARKERTDDIQTELQRATGDRSSKAQCTEATGHQRPAGAVLRGEARGQTGLPLPDGGRDHAPAGEGADPVVEAIIEQTETHLDQFDLGRESEVARAEAGGNYAAPPPAGGDDAVAFAALEALYDGEPPKLESGTYKLAMEKLGLVLAQRGVRDVAAGRKAGELMREANRKNPAFLNPALKTFESAFDVFVAEAQKQGGKTSGRRARYDTPAVRVSQAAFDERMAARPPPAEDDKVGRAVKAELQLQASRNVFETWIKPASFTCDDGGLTVTATNDLARDWLDSHLRQIIQRVAVGVVGGAVEVRFEAGGLGEAGA